MWEKIYVMLCYVMCFGVGVCIRKMINQTLWTTDPSMSLQSVISKMYEKLIFTKIYYLNTNNFIYDKQFGFWRELFHQPCINKHCRIHSKSSRYRSLCLWSFCWFRKNIWYCYHEILCKKLDYYGLWGNVNKLMKSYLAYRKQYVSINGFDSEIRNRNCGVSTTWLIMGQLLFLIYTHDVRLCLNETGHFVVIGLIFFHSQCRLMVFL